MPENNAHMASETARTVPAHHMALIAAAVAATCGRTAHILGISPVDAGRTGEWVRLGRIGLHGSHRPAGRTGIVRLLAKQDRGARNK